MESKPEGVPAALPVAPAEQEKTPADKPAVVKTTTIDVPYALVAPKGKDKPAVVKSTPVEVSSTPVAPKGTEFEVTKGFPKQDAYADLSLLERALSLTLALPPWSPPEPLKSETQRKEFLGDAYPTLRDLLSTESYHLNRLCTSHKPEPMGLGGLTRYFLFKAEHWAGTSSHQKNRSELIDLLNQLRACVLESLRIIPPPQSNRVPVPDWDSLSERQSRIVRLVAKRPMSGKDIATALSKQENKVTKWATIRRDLAVLTRRGILENVPKREYRLVRVPEHPPSDLFSEPSEKREASSKTDETQGIKPPQ